MLEFIKALDIDYDASFRCPICSKLSHDKMVLIMDGKEMGLKKSLAKPYISPSTEEVSPVPVEW